MKNHNRSRKGKGIFLVAFVLFAVFLGALVVKKYETSLRKPQVPPSPVQTGTVLVALLFAAPDGAGLVREGREITAGSTLEESAKEVLENLVSGPLGDYAPTLPHGTRILSVQVTGELARLDFGKELVEGLPAGSSAEMLAVYSVVDTLAVNFPQIKRVQFTIEGATVATLKGHLDLRGPLTPDLSMEQK